MINQLVANIKKTGAPIVVGLDPMLNYIPEQVQKKAFAEYGETLEGAAEAIWQFNKEIVDKTYDLIPAVKPQIAMYDIKVMIMEDGFIMNEDSDLLATVGIVDDTKVNMIPYQVDSTLGYQKGIVLSGNASAEEVLLDVLVTWNNENMTKSFREFYQIKLNMNGFDLISNESDGTN